MVRRSVVFLNGKELKKLEDFRIPAGRKALGHVRDIFLFRYYTRLRCSDVARLTLGFHYLVALMVGIDPMQTSVSYSLRDVQEKYYRQMKSTQGCNRQGNWSEDEKTGHLFILFASMILSPYVKYIWKSTGLKNMFCSPMEILDEMQSIRCIEYSGNPSS